MAEITSGEILHTGEILHIIINAEKEAAQLMLSAGEVLAERKTGRRDVVTEYDRKVQALLMERLSAALPGAKFFCEENMQRDDLDGEHVFIIDPIDGTMNFVHGFNHSCISVAYRHRGVLSAAAVYNPYVDEMFSAVKGEGAFLNGRPIHIHDDGLSESVVCCGTAPYDVSLTDRSFEMIKKAFLAGLDIRRQGSAELDLCSVAAGRAGLYFELQVSLWDYAAGMLIVQEAGGTCLNIDGSEMPFDGSKPGILAGGKKAIADFLKLQ